MWVEFTGYYVEEWCSDGTYKIQRWTSGLVEGFVKVGNERFRVTFKGQTPHEQWREAEKWMRLGGRSE